MNKDNRRTIVLINKSFQFRLIAKFVILNIIIMILFGCCMYIFLNSEIESKFFSAHVTYNNLKDMLFPIIITLSLLNIIISSLIIGVFVLFASHKVAGPFYRFNEALKDIGERNLSPLTSIREGDQLYECSVSLKKISDLFSGDFRQIQDKLNEVTDSISKDESKDAILSKVKEISSIVDQYKV